MMIRDTRRTTPTTLRVVVLLTALALGSWGCPVKFVSDYDAVTDPTATALQTKVDTFLVKMVGLAGKPEGTYASNKSFYEEMSGALDAWHSRAAAVPLNTQTAKQIELLKDSMEKLRQLHEGAGANGLRPDLVAIVKGPLDVHFESIIALEDFKKRGKK